MEEKLNKLREEIDNLLQEKNNYEKNKKNEIFIEDVNKDEDQLIKEAENILDRKIENKKRINKIIATEKEGHKQLFHSHRDHI